MALGRIQARRITIRAKQPAGLHVHDGPVVGTILECSAVFQVDGQLPETLGPGDAFYEPEGARIARFDAGPDGVTFVAFFPLRNGQTPGLTFPDE